MNHAELSHKWAHAKPGESRKAGSMHFSGATLYSYATPIARIYENKRGRAVLISPRSYSNTTSKHIGLAWRATSHLPQFRVPSYAFGSYAGGRYAGTTDPKRAHADNLAYFQSEMARLLAEAGRVMREGAVEWRARDAAELHKAMADYMIFFGIRRKMPALLSFAAAYERARRIENPDPKSLDARERARAKRAAHAGEVAEYRQEMMRSMREAGHDYLGYRVHVGKRWPAMLARKAGITATARFIDENARRTDWRLHEAFGAHHHSFTRDGAVMLRINGEQIETSLGARIPLAAAPIVWRIYQDALSQGGREFEHIGMASRVRVGDYPIDRVEADGTLVAGCHRIPGSEIRGMARTLNLAGAV